MIERLILACIRKRTLAAIVALLAGAYGYLSWTRLALEAYPDLGPVTVLVTTQVAGLASEEVEQQITIPLERALNGTPRLVSMRSSSTFGLSLITLVFEDGADDYWVRQRVTERTGQVTLPNSVTPQLSPVSGPAGEIFRYTLESDAKNLMELSEIQRWVVVPALQQVAGVAAVNNFGGFTKQFRLDLNPAALLRYGVALNDVTTAINNNSSNGGGSRLVRGEQSFVVRGVGLVRSLGDLGGIVVASRNGVPITVGDLGTLAYSNQEREGIVGKDANPDAVEGIVVMLRGQNPSAVLKRLHLRIDELRHQTLDRQEVRIVPYIDRDELVHATVGKVSHTVLEGIGLVFFVLILFLGSPRSAVVVAVTVPLSLVALFAIMNLLHMPANLFSLGAIDFGIIVDGAIVVTEAVLRRREEAPERALGEEEVARTAAQVARPIFFATLIIITAYFPLFAFENAEGKLLSPMAYSVGFALFGALVCTFCLVPGLAYTAFRRPRHMVRNVPLEWLQRGYAGLLGGLLRVPAIAFGIAGAALAAVVVLGLGVGREFLPDLDEGALWLQVQLPTGISLETASGMASDLRRALREFPEVSYAVTQLGRSDDGTDPWTPSHIEAPVGLTPYHTWPAGETKAEFVAKLRERLERLPGFDVGISQPIIDNVNDLVGGAHSPLVVRVYGEDFRELRRIAQGIADELKGVRGTADASIFQEPPIPQVVVRIDRGAAARYGINVNDITALISTGIGGAPVAQVYVEDRQYAVTVRFDAAARRSPEALGSLVLTAPGGAQIPLSQLADIRLQSGESVISREMTHRNLTVRIDLRGRDLASYLAEAQQRIDEKVRFDRDAYRLEYAGQFENQRRAQARLVLVMALVLSLMLVLLYAGFGRLRQALLTLGIVPLAALGGLVALHLTAETLNVATAVGFIALFGVAVQNAIIMVANLNHHREEGLRLREAVLAGAAERFRPVMMTATVATLGMLPAALATGVGSDVQRGLATVVVGGLIGATLLTLFVLPASYYVLEGFVERRAAAAAARRPVPQPAAGE